MMTAALLQSPQEAVEFHLRSMAEYKAVEFETVDELRSKGEDLKAECAELADRWSLDARTFASEWDALIEKKASLFICPEVQPQVESAQPEQPEPAPEEPLAEWLRRLD